MCTWKERRVYCFERNRSLVAYKGNIVLKYNLKVLLLQYSDLEFLFLIFNFIVDVIAEAYDSARAEDK